MTDEQQIARPGEFEEQVDSRFDERLDDEAIKAIEDAENEAPDPDEFGLKVAAPTGEMAIHAQNLGVRYNMNLTRKTKLRTTFANLLDPRRRNQGHFWALRGVDLEVRRGEAIGIIGPNGSGKSTILLALAGILQPSEGSVEVNGHVSTLLSLNAGFDAELTGRENIALAGALMGIDDEVMREITPGIIKFANIGAFIDAPMKTYSSGMRARVGFSVATAVDPDILLLDEVLGTGDNAFKKKSKKRIAEVLRSAKAVVMVTHDMSWITAFCTRAILLDHGSIVADGDPEEIAEMHVEDTEKRRAAKRQARLLMRKGVIDTVNVNKALKDGTLTEILEGNEEALAEIEAKREARREKAKQMREDFGAGPAAGAGAAAATEDTEAEEEAEEEEEEETATGPESKTKPEAETKPEAVAESSADERP